MKEDSIEKPKWIKVLNWIAIIFFLGAVISLFVFMGMDFGGLGMLILSVPLAGVGVLLLSFNFFYYIKRRNKVLGNILLSILLIFFGIVFIISTLGLMRIQPFDYWDIADWFLYPLQIVIIIFLIILVYYLNKKN